MPSGYLMLVLHAHLPYVHHPEHERFLEERWLFEAITETYIPLIKFFDRLRAERLRFRVTLSISPTLAAMLDNELLCERYMRHLDLTIRLASAEVDRTRHWPDVNRLACMYRTLFEEARQVFVERSGKRLLPVFKGYADEGLVELITCGATHGFLPALEPASARAQVLAALAEHERIFGKRPKGIWLPECGFAPGLDQVLADAGVRYTFVDTHGLEHASPRPLFGVNAPVYCPSGVAVFGRHAATSKLVWSSIVGYPSDPAYREYYRDIGFDLEQNYLAPYQCVPGLRTATGIKYHRITGPGPNKHLYDPDRGREAAARHAHDFVGRCRDQVNRASQRMPFPCVLVSPYDAELFGHWWFEGPQWINFVLRELASDATGVTMATPSEYLAQHPVQQRSMPSPSSWGRNGYAEQWLNAKTAWLWRPLHEAFVRLQEASRRTVRAPLPLHERLLRQATRELMLAQDSDWPFAIANGTTEQYARRRIADHLGRCHDLLNDLESRKIDTQKLAALEHLDAILPSLDYKLLVDE